MNRRLIALALLLLLFVGCQKYAALHYGKQLSLPAQGSETITVDPIAAARSVAVNVTCAGKCDAYLVIGPAGEVAKKINNGQEPASGTYHSKLGGTGGTVQLELAANKEFHVIVRNSGNKPLEVSVKIDAETK